jgi:hypothetical protein
MGVYILPCQHCCSSQIVKKTKSNQQRIKNGQQKLPFLLHAFPPPPPCADGQFAAGADGSNSEFRSSAQKAWKMFGLQTSRERGRESSETGKN